MVAADEDSAGHNNNGGKIPLPTCLRECMPICMKIRVAEDSACQKGCTQGCKQLQGKGSLFYKVKNYWKLIAIT